MARRAALQRAHSCLRGARPQRGVGDVVGGAQRHRADGLARERGLYRQVRHAPPPRWRGSPAGSTRPCPRAASTAAPPPPPACRSSCSCHPPRGRPWTATLWRCAYILLPRPVRYTWRGHYQPTRPGAMDDPQVRLAHREPRGGDHRPLPPRRLPHHDQFALVLPGHRRPGDGVHARPRPGDGPLRGGRGARRRSHRSRLGHRERGRRGRGRRSRLRQTELRHGALGAGRAGDLPRAHGAGSGGQDRRHRARRRHATLLGGARRQGQGRVQLGRDRGQAPGAGGRHRRDHRDGRLAARQQLARGRDGARVDARS